MENTAVTATNQQQAVPELIPLCKWEKLFGFPTTSSLRWMRFNGRETGFSAVIRTLGSRVYIHKPSFDKWLSEQVGK